MNKLKSNKLKKINGVLCISLIALCLSASSLLVQGQIKDKTTFSVETDPSTFALKGFAAHFRIKPKNSKHWVVGAGTYALDLPSVMVNLNSENKDNGWNVRINSAYSFFGEYYTREANAKWFVGLQAGIQNYKNTNDYYPSKESEYSNLLVMPSIGYQWRPFEAPFYFKPWAGLGYTTKISGNNSIDDLTYTISPLVPFVTLHVGYSF